MIAELIQDIKNLRSKQGILDFLRKYQEIILYLIIGVLTTILNAAVYYVASEKMLFGTVPSTIAAWVVAVIFAFLANKFIVFRQLDMKRFFFEFYSFLTCRIGTGLLDVLFMNIMVDHMHCNGILMKLISDVFVTIVNFIVSKFFIFKKKKELHSPKNDH